MAWSGAMKRGGGGGGSEGLPLQKEGEGTFLAILKGGDRKSFGVVSMVLEVLTILEGGTTGFHPLIEYADEASTELSHKLKIICFCPTDLSKGLCRFLLFLFWPLSLYS